MPLSSPMSISSCFFPPPFLLFWVHQCFTFIVVWWNTFQNGQRDTQQQAFRQYKLEWTGGQLAGNISEVKASRIGAESAKSRVQSYSIYCKVNIDYVPLDKSIHWRTIGLPEIEVATKELSILRWRTYKEPLNTAARDASPGEPIPDPHRNHLQCTARFKGPESGTFMWMLIHALPSKQSLKI